MYLIKVWNNEGMVFEGYSKIIPKAGQDFKAWSITKEDNGTVKQIVYSPAEYRITYEDTQTK